MNNSALLFTVPDTMNTMDKKTAVDEAVKYIVNLNGELSEFFSINSSEVYDMCITEYDEAKHLENVKQEGIEQGHEDVFAIQDYIKANPNKSDVEIAEKFKCNVLLVQESRKRT